uniref:Uncharacterized protein n=1 Tax=viral metagenome TaxID=1070528 RepID=A0A6C0HY37_9ZZZZ
MCWNKDISLNTFLFSMFVLLLIIYNNKYTKYKIQELNNFWIYMFFISFIFIQLVEYFIWSNIKNPYYNNVFSIVAQLILLVQPIVSLMLLNDYTIRKWMLSIYLLGMIPFAIYQFCTIHLYSSVTQDGHLKWHLFAPNTPIVFFIWLFFFLFSIFYNGNYFGFLFGLITLIITTYNYSQDQSVSSMWCWIVNSVMIYYAAYLILYLPFCEKKKLC